MTNNQLMTQHSNFLKSEAVQHRLQEVVGKRSNQFATTLLSILRDNDMLAKADTNSVMTAALKAIALDLPIEPSLGLAYVVPFNNTKKRIVEAQFQLGYKGLVQLAQRSGKYKSINAGVVYKSQFISYNPLFEELEIDFSKPQDEVAGYFAAFKLINGFEKVLYWTKAQAEAHGKRFSKSYNFGPWKSDFDAMAQKTVLKQIISKYGPLSIEMEEALVADNETENVNGVPIDVTPKETDETLDSIMGPVIEPEPSQELTGKAQGTLKTKDEDLVNEEETTLKTAENEPSDLDEILTEQEKQANETYIDGETGEIIEEISFFEGDTTNIKE